MKIEKWKEELIVAFIKRGLEEYNTPTQIGEMLVELLWILYTKEIVK